MGFLTGGFDYDIVRANASQIPQAWIAVIVAALIIGFGVKLAAFLVHVWLPDTYTDAPTPISCTDILSNDGDRCVRSDKNLD